MKKQSTAYLNGRVRNMVRVISCLKPSESNLEYGIKLHKKIPKLIPWQWVWDK